MIDKTARNITPEAKYEVGLLSHILVVKHNYAHNLW